MDEGPNVLDWEGLMGELWTNRAVLADLGTWHSTEVTANGRLMKSAMIAVQFRR